MNAMHAVLRAAVRWRRNEVEVRQLEPRDEGRGPCLALVAARRRRGGLTSTLARAVDRLIAEAEAEEAS